MLRNHKTLLIVIALAGVILLLSQCINSASASTDPRGELYAGAATCRQCHQAIYDSFASTAHFAATAPANKNNVLGNFKEGQNQFNYDDSSTVKMEQRGNDFFQVLYVGGKEQNAYKYELLFGKKHAQSAVFWADNKTLQLPITHYNTFNAWGTSPGAGYSIAKPIFNRYISTECYECHSANVSTQEASFKEMDEPKLDRGSVVYGIDCERCHGPGMNHVNYHQAYPGEKVSLTFGSSGKFRSQIEAGAPFDLFLSADTPNADAIVRAGKASGPAFPYAKGRLSLWVKANSKLKLDASLGVLRDPSIQHIAVANPAHAPYGLIAQNALREAGVEALLRPKLVFGENISQTAQFVESGAAEIGLIARSLAESPALKKTGRSILVAEALYAPLRQAGVVIKGPGEAAASKFRAYFLKEGRPVLQRFGLDPW
ncbi:MAG: molybdate ABC transporter substrate-binding protein [Proteobacteria bacterium]|nr:MAG: molybdate ABC transporter substrate-binding protein [Pseudomonadota bacterium]